MKELSQRKNYDFVDQQLPALKEELNHCRDICIDNNINLENILQSITTIQNNINKLLINPANDFDHELFFATLDKIRDIFALAINDSKK